MSHVGERFTFGDKSLPYNPNTKRNIADSLHWMSDLQINDMLESQALNYSILLVNLELNGNIGSAIRNFNAFGPGQEVIIFGHKKINRVPCCGTDFYTKFRHVRFIDSIEPLFSEFQEIIAIENNLPGAISLQNHTWDKNKKTLIIFGKEVGGIPDYILEKCDKAVYIEQRGSVRSVNIACASAIIMYSYMSQITENI